MKNNEDVKILYEINEEIIKDNGDIEITFNDKDKTIRFDIKEDFKSKIITNSDLDPQSIIKAPSTGKYYCETLSSPGTKEYIGIKEINKKINDISNNYQKIMDESQGQYNNGWIFNFTFLSGYKYLFVIDSNPILKVERPIIIELILAPFKIDEYYMNYPVYNQNGLEGIINFNFNMDEKKLTMTSTTLDKNSEIAIYKSKNKVF